MVFIPLLSFWFRQTREHYRKVGAQLAMADPLDFLNLLPNMSWFCLSRDFTAGPWKLSNTQSLFPMTFVSCLWIPEPQVTERLKSAWEKMNTGLKLVILPSPFRSIITPNLEYGHSVDREADDDMLTVVIPEFVPARWWQTIYHNQTAFLICSALLFEPEKVVTSVRHHLTR